MSFYKQLKIGNKKENYVCNILNLCNINAKPNNIENVKDMDLIIDDLKILLDVKYLHTPFNNSMAMVKIEPENCILININHVNNYYLKQNKTGYKSWVVFLIDYKEYNINELKFIDVNYLKYLVDSNEGITDNGKLYLNKNNCLDMRFFLNYCYDKINLKPKKYNFK